MKQPTFYAIIGICYFLLNDISYLFNGIKYNYGPINYLTIIEIPYIIHSLIQITAHTMILIFFINLYKKQK